MSLEHQQKLEEELKRKVDKLLPSCQNRYYEYEAILKDYNDKLDPFIIHSLKNMLYEAIANQGFISFSGVLNAGWTGIFKNDSIATKQKSISKQIINKWVSKYYVKTKKCILK